MDTALRRYDYIVIGGGSAGSIVASRLTERADQSVLLLEAGGWDRHLLLRIPFGVAKAWNNPRWNWSYSSSPEPSMNGRVLFHPRGKLIGGSGSINMMAFVRGHSREYDGWAQGGLSDWSWEKVLPYFKRLETFSGGVSDVRGGSGPIYVGRRDDADSLIDVWLRAGLQAGYSPNSDYNGVAQEGVSITQSNMGDGRRQSAGACYLRPALSRSNLNVVTHAEVLKLDLEGRKVSGVEYKRNGVTYHAVATREVILCAGAYNTPKLMMLSGLGPAKHLREHGINVVLDIAEVGQNLQDHTSVLVEHAAARPTNFHHNLRWDRLTWNMLRALLVRSGPATRPMSIGMAFLKSAPQLDVPDIQIIFRPFARDARPWFPGLIDPFDDRLGFVVCHLRPAARGSVQLSSAVHHHQPVILNRFFEQKSDLLALSAGVRMARHIARQDAFATILGPEVLPGSQISSDEEIEAFIRGTATTLFHPCGTCRMGVDSSSVVDEHLRVRGIGGLRIIDASVMPSIVGGNINACVMMIAEKAADMIANGQKI